MKIQKLVIEIHSPNGVDTDDLKQRVENLMCERLGSENAVYEVKEEDAAPCAPTLPPLTFPPCVPTLPPVNYPPTVPPYHNWDWPKWTCQQSPNGIAVTEAAGTASTGVKATTDVGEP